MEDREKSMRKTERNR